MPVTRRLHRICLFIAVLACTGTAWDLSATASMAAESRRLSSALAIFNSMEIKGPLNALPLWQDLVIKARQQIKEFNRCQEQQHCEPAASSWLKMYLTSVNLPRMQQLKQVNAFFNRWPYRLDIDLYQRTDYWATPKEFLSQSGDCEDYCITKYFALRQLGFKSQDLRIVVLLDTIRNLGHAVLIVNLENNVYVLDNISDFVLPQESYRHYQPQFSLNENSRWVHLVKMDNR